MLLSSFFNNLPGWAIFLLVTFAVFDSVMKIIALWKSARNNHLVWFIFLAIVNSLGILPIIYLLIHGKKVKPES